MRTGTGLPSISTATLSLEPFANRLPRIAAAPPGLHAGAIPVAAFTTEWIFGPPSAWEAVPAGFVVLPMIEMSAVCVLAIRRLLIVTVWEGIPLCV